MKKMNGLKIFALVVLSLSKFETMFGMKENEKEDNINDEYVNKNYYLIDHLGNKITLDNDEDIKFKIYLETDINKMSGYKNKDILKISEEGSNKILTTFAADENEEEKKYPAPIVYVKREVIIWHKEKNDDKLNPAFFELNKEEREEYKKKTIPSYIVKKIGEDSINDDYILVDAENNKIEKINDKNYKFQLLTRKKYLELKGKLNQQENWLKNGEKKYFFNHDKLPVMFEEKDGGIVLYVQHKSNEIALAGVEIDPWVGDNYTKINIRKKEGDVSSKNSSKISSKKTTDKNKTKDCCCICCC